MLRIETHKMEPDHLIGEYALWAYNGLDAMITVEIWQELQKQMSPEARLVYEFELGMTAPAMEMMLRGILVDKAKRWTVATKLQNQIDRVLWVLDKLAKSVWGKGLNPNSPKQLQEFFYGALGIPAQYKSGKGKSKISTNRETLELLHAQYFISQPFINCILTCRDIGKKLSVLKSGIDQDDRMRSSYNVGGTDTGRWSSSENAFNTGTNSQNITESLREAFIADDGYKMAYLDLEQAESRGVGALAFAVSGQTNYLNACESGDLHTTVSRMVWPDMPWTGDLAHDKAIAEQLFYRTYSYRDMSKRGGHGTNYYGKPYTMAKNLKVDRSIMEAFQPQYFSAFPEIPFWHRWVNTTLQTEAMLTTPMGRKRTFFGRLDDDNTLRKAIAHCPQSTIADVLNIGVWRVWKHGAPIQLLGQIHDAILMQYPEHLEAHCLDLASRLMQVKFTVEFKGKTREIIIPVEAKSGWNWGRYSEENPDGLRKWTGQDTRTRQSSIAKGVLDYKLY